MLEGWGQESGPRHDSHQPITPGILRGLKDTWQGLCSLAYEARLFHAAALLAFFGALRISELVAASKGHTSSRALFFHDLKMGRRSVEVNIQQSKTDQIGKGRSLVLGKCSEAELCPVTALLAYVSLRGTGEGYLFRHQDGTPLTKH